MADTADEMYNKAAMQAAGFYDPTRQTAVGDLNSQAKGSGARDNAGKVRVDLLAFEDVADLLMSRDGPIAALGLFQETHETAHLRQLVRLLYGSTQADMQAALRDAAAVFEFGAKKYKAWNWYKGMPWSVPVGCIGRHLLAIERGEALDADSGLHHRGHVVCNVFMLLAYNRMYQEGNDLPPKREPLAYGTSAKLLQEAKEAKTAGMSAFGAALGRSRKHPYPLIEADLCNPGDSPAIPNSGGDQSHKPLRHRGDGDSW